MTGSAILLAWFLGLFLAASLLVLYTYRRRELSVRGRGVLTALRLAALAVLIFLVLDPTYPVSGSATGDGPWILLDRSASMSAATPDGTAWDVALERARARVGGRGTLALFGEEVQVGDEPEFSQDARTELQPALERAAEAGAREVVVISDLRFHDLAEVRALASRLSLDVEFDRIGGDVRNAGVADVDIPAALDAGEPVSASVRLFAQGASGETATLEWLEEGLVVASSEVVLPDDGRELAVEAELPPTDAEGAVRYSARLRIEGDAYPSDDERSVLAEVDPEEGNLVLVSFSPDWEVRFLLPVLERVSGLPGRGFVQMLDDTFLSLEGTGAVGTADRETVERMANGAELLVVQGRAEGDAWLDAALDRVRRSVVLVRDAPDARRVGFANATVRAGEWYASPELPGSPLAGELSGTVVAGLPPLSTLVLPGDDLDALVPLEVQLRGAGPALPALLLRTTESGARQAVTLASGFWRWGFRDGEAEETYGRLWSAVAGWLLADEPLARGPGVRPLDPVLGPTEVGEWTAAGLVADTVTLRLTRGDTLAIDTTLAVGVSGRFETPPLAPGDYRYEADVGEGEEAATWSGRIVVESWNGDMMPRVGEVVGFTAESASGADGVPRDRRPWRTLPWPYLLVIALLSAEWAGRRRLGLR